MNTADRLNNLDAFLHTISEENHAGLGGEAGYYVFSYDPKDEMRIRQWTKNEIELFGGHIVRLWSLTSTKSWRNCWLKSIHGKNTKTWRCGPAA